MFDGRMTRPQVSAVSDYHGDGSGVNTSDLASETAVVLLFSLMALLPR